MWVPRATASAFLAGRRSRSLHGTTLDAAVLDAPLEAVRKSDSRASQWFLRDRVRFTFLIAEAGLIVLAPIALIAGVTLYVLA